MRRIASASQNSCSWDRAASIRSSRAQPMREEYLLTGALEPTNDAYAIAKLAGIKMCQAYRAPVRLRCRQRAAHQSLRPERQLQRTHVACDSRADSPHARRQAEWCARVRTCGAVAHRRREFLHADDFAAAMRHRDGALLRDGADQHRVGRRPHDRRTGAHAARRDRICPPSLTSIPASPMARRASCSRCRASRRSAGSPRSAWPRGWPTPTAGSASTTSRRRVAGGWPWADIRPEISLSQ